MNNFEKYNELREKFPEFIFKGFDYEDTGEELHITYNFSVPGLSDFAPDWRIPKSREMGYIEDEIDENITFQNMIFNLGMIELVSYYKIACPKNVIIDVPGALAYIDEDALFWWKEQYFYGLGEFFYTNEIPLDKEGFMNISFGERASMGADKLKGHSRYADVYDYNEIKRDSKRFMIPVGGGKDSAVTLELLKEYKKDSYCYMINGRGATFATAAAADFDGEHVIVAKRSLDKRMLDLNKAGYLNGHTPFSAMTAFSCILVGYMYGLPYVALSNESSANESTVEGSTVNHQYSKSFEFEHDFVTYEEKYIKSGVKYFSLLRPWSEYQIAREFAKHEQYFCIFRSCNVGSKEDKWCGHCAKCLFVYYILSPFIDADEMVKIFGKNLLGDESLWELTRELTGMVSQKPFECVGSRSEVNIAISETIAKFEREGRPLPVLLAKYKDTPLYKPYREEENPYINYFETRNNVPEFLIGLLK